MKLKKAALAIPGSWQMEFFRRDDFLALSGGLADREFGHWLNVVGPGEQFASPVAYLSTVQGDLDDLCARLVQMQLPAAEAAPASIPEMSIRSSISDRRWRLLRWIVRASSRWRAVSGSSRPAARRSA